jgi:hypothetical protein
MTFLIIFAFLKFIDVYSTFLCLKRKGNAEGNKVLAWLMGRFGVVPVLIANFLIVVVPFVVYRERVPLWAWVVLIAVQGLIAVNNIRAYRGQSTIF